MGTALIERTIEIETPKPERRLTPLRAVRRYCLWCCGDQANEVRLCPSQGCPLHDWRFGRKPKDGGSTLRIIRERCLDCAGFSPAAVRECWDTSCTLYLYRMGKNPNWKGKRGNPEALRKWREAQTAKINSV